MDRRQFLVWGVPALAAAQGAGKKKTPEKEIAIANPTADRTPRVAIVRSDFRAGMEHDGSKLAGLKTPRPVDSELTQPQIDAMLARALDLGGGQRGRLEQVVARDHWVVIKPSIPIPFGKPGFCPGLVTDPRLVRSLVGWLMERGRGQRITIAEGPELQGDIWGTDWGPHFGGVSYQAIVQEFSRRYPKVRFETVNLNDDPVLDIPVPGDALAAGNPGGAYAIPKTVQQCDSLIALAPLRTDRRAGVALGIGSFTGIAPGSRYGFPKDGLTKLGKPEQVALDLFRYHPADFSLLGGTWQSEGDGSPFRYNIVISGASALAVDAVGAAVMGFHEKELPLLKLGWSKGLGEYEVEVIWTRGNELEEARRVFRHAD